MSDYLVTGMDCASCARNIERGVAALPGVTCATLNFTTGRMHVDGGAPESVLARVEELGYRATPNDGASLLQLETPVSGGVLRSWFAWLLSRPTGRVTLVAAILILPGLLFDELLPIFGVEYSQPVFRWMALGALVLAGWPVARSAWRTLIINHQISINLLMTIAAAGAVVLGAWTEAALVMVLFAIGESMEGYTALRARSSLASLLALAPEEAIVLRPCIDCHEHLGTDGYSGGPCPFCGIEEQRVPVASILVGEQVIVRPGDRFPVDGRVVEGRTAVNQAPITGESVPVDKEIGDEVFAGTINGEGVVTVDVTHLAAETTLARIIRQVEDAQDRRAPVQSTVDRFASVYTPVVVLIALLVAMIPPLLLSAPFWGEQGSFYRALELLVVACPCALVISTPVTIVSAVSRAATLGILVKGGSVLQALAGVDAVAFDKTGTLTRGRPQVTRVKSVECVNDDNGDCAVCDDLLGLAYAVERRSEHALARAVVERAVGRGVDGLYAPASTVTASVGRGVAGVVAGQQVFVGSHAWFDSAVPHDAAICSDLSAAASQGKTPLLLSVDDHYAGYILVSDATRPEAPAVVGDLRTLGVKEILLISGDDQAAAQNVGHALGVDRVIARALPETKLDAIRSLQANGRQVAMVGDGINDAPALAAANVGIAMGEGAAQAIETADTVLLGDTLRQVPVAMRLARAALRTVRTNIGVAVGIKAVVFLLILAGTGSLWMAVVADVGASLLVTLNGTRMMRWSPPSVAY